MVSFVGTALGVAMYSVLMAQNAPTQVEPSRQLVVKWGAVIAADKNKEYLRGNEESRALDREFERLNGGCDGALAMLGTILNGRALEARRAAARVIGSIRFGVGNGVGDWDTFRSRELQLASKYVLDHDPETATNATTAFVDLLGGERWDKWSKVAPTWKRALVRADGPQARNLAKLYAFTSVPLSGAVPGLYRLFQSSDEQTRLDASCAVARAYLWAPDETRAVVVAGANSDSPGRRLQTFKCLETLAPIVWDDWAAHAYGQTRVEANWSLQNAWERSSSASKPNVHESRRQNDKELLATLEAGLADQDPGIRLSSVRALVPIGKQVDLELSSGTRRRLDTGKPEVARLLLRASTVIQQDAPALARQARNLAMGFDRMRVIG